LKLSKNNQPKRASLLFFQIFRRNSLLNFSALAELLTDLLNFLREDSFIDKVLISKSFPMNFLNDLHPWTNQYPLEHASQKKKPFLIQFKNGKSYAKINVQISNKIKLSVHDFILSIFMI
jgi:hypothetical protein